MPEHSRKPPPQSSGNPWSDINPLSRIVSIVTSAKETRTKPVRVGQILGGIKTGHYREEVENIRKVYDRAKSEMRDPKKAVASLKEKLPGITWSGEFKTRKKGVPLDEKLLRHSGIICADLDNIQERLTEIRSKLASSPYLIGMFASPTGTGLKALFRVPPDADKHRASFESVNAHVRELTGIEIDPACKDITRLCFVSVDPDTHIRENADTLPVNESQSEGGNVSVIRLNTESCIATSCVPASLHNSSESILANIKARQQTLSALEKREPILKRLYTELIEPRFQAVVSARNHFITQAVPFLYRAVAEDYIIDLVLCFYDCNRTLFKDSRETHEKEAKAMLNSVIETYAASLSNGERAIYNALEKTQEQDAFRICRDLALLDRLEREPFAFYLSFTHLADRLGLYPVEAQRIMRRLENYGLIRLLAKGTRRAAGVPGRAGEYQWLLSTNRHAKHSSDPNS